jgi:hypothetical protein
MSGSLTRGERLQRALVSAFPSAERLDELVALRLDENPAVVAAGPDLSARVFSLTEWAAKRGRVGDLIGGVEVIAHRITAAAATAASTATATLHLLRCLRVPLTHSLCQRLTVDRSACEGIHAASPLVHR